MSPTPVTPVRVPVHIAKPKPFTKADLAFVDAALDMYKATQMQVAAGEATVNNTVKAMCDPVDVVAAVVAVTVLAYHAYNSCILQDEASTVAQVTGSQLKLTSSLKDLVAKREQFAAQFNER